MLHRLELRCAGEGDPLILVHGIQGNAEAWASILPVLGKESRCVMPNLPGRKFSARWRPQDGAIEDFYSLGHYAQILAELVRHYSDSCRRPVALAGWSMGVSVILEYAQRFGLASVSRIVLCSGTPKAADGALWFKSDSLEGLVGEAQQRALRLGLKDPADHEAVAWSWKSVLAADHVQVLPRIFVPTLVIHGERDDDCPIAHGQRMANDITGAQWCPLPGVGHSIFGEAAEEVGQAMATFLHS